MGYLLKASDEGDIIGRDELKPMRREGAKWRGLMNCTHSTTTIVTYYLHSHQRHHCHLLTALAPLQQFSLTYCTHTTATIVTHKQLLQYSHHCHSLTNISP